MSKKLRPTLRQVFAISLLALLLVLSLLFYLVFNGSQQTILESSELLRNLASQEVGRRVTDYLNEAPAAAEYFEKQLDHGLIDPKDPVSIQAGLLLVMVQNENLSEASFTFADSPGFDSDGYLQINPSTVGQVCVFKSSNGRFISRRTYFDGTRLVCVSTALEGSQQAASSASPTTDPTDHATFKRPASQDYLGRLLWTDLHWSQLDDALPESQRRVELSVQKGLTDSNGRFRGVLRVGLLKERIDAATKLHLSNSSEPDPYCIFLCDNQGRLITSTGPSDRVAEFGEDLRIVSPALRPEIAEALRQPILKAIDSEQPIAAASFRSGQEIYLCTFRALPATQEWIVGILVPRTYYLGPLLAIRAQALWASLALIGGIVVVGGLILRGVGRAHSLIVRETSRMNAFDFSSSTNSSRLGDVADVLAGLEKAKTAMRAMGKYVPVDLVRKLYRDGKEPVLGGESVELSVLFTDIKDFTPFAERIPPDRLAEILGRYLDVMATVIQGQRGTIDKYIGDAVMAFWNAPESIANHAVLACRAALECQKALQTLYASPEWTDWPRFETRFGLHRCPASVGHFGAPDRFNYTAIGDGINFTSRLEGLNKYYGTTIIVSDCIYSEAKGEFAFRLLDHVAVKGKTEGVTIYELLGEGAMEGEQSDSIVRYQQAFELYRSGDFPSALSLLEAESNDPPTSLLAARCRRFIQVPPSTGWNGVHVFESK